MDYHIQERPLPTKSAKYVDAIDDTEVYVVRGGDGTMIRIAAMITALEREDIILMGINEGHVGFLSNDIDDAEAASYLDLPHNEFVSYVSSRSILNVKAQCLNLKGLNEVVVQPTHRGQLLQLDVEVNGQCIQYKGDGIIVSTSSGSTAYNLSANGPIVSPLIDVMILTPICPFTLASRPLVIDKNSVVQIYSKDFIDVFVDGRNTNNNTNEIEIGLFDKKINLFKKDDFLVSIQKKLGWNNNIRM